MKEQIQKLSKHTMIYGLGVILDKAVGFIMLPIYTRHLTPADYGVLELLMMTIDVISMVAGLGLTASIFKYYMENDDPLEKNEIISTASILMIGVSLITAVVGLLFSSRLSRLVFGGTDQLFYLRLFFVIYFLQSGIVTIPILFIRALQNSGLFVMINFIKSLFQVSLNIYFVVWLEMGILGILYSVVISNIVIGIYVSIYMFRQVGIRFSFQKGKRLVKFGYPFIFVSLSSFVLVFSDRYFLNAFTSLDAVGIYALAYKFAFLTGFLVVVPFEQIWESQRFEIAKQENASLIFKKVFSYFNILIISTSLIISLFVKDVVVIISDPAYHNVYKLVPIVALAYIIQAWTFHCNLGIYIGNKSKYLAIGSVCAALGVIVFNFILIPAFGIYGAASAAVIAFSLRFVLVYFFSQKYYRIDYGWGKQVSLLAAATGIYMTSRFLAIPNVPLSIGISICLASFFLAFVYLFFLDDNEKTFIKQVLKKPLLIPSILPKPKI